MSQISRPRLFEVDLGRCAAMLAVLGVHADAWMGHAGAGGVVYPALDRLLRFCVPLFVVLSGYVLARTAGAGPLDRARFARRRALRLAVPLGAWLLVYLAAGLLLGTVRPASVLDVPALVWDRGVGGHLYYLAVAAQLALLFAVVPRGPRASLVLLAVAAPAQVGLCALRDAGWAPGGPLGAVFGLQAQWFAVWWWGCFAAGAAAGWRHARLEPLLRRWCPAVLLLAAAVAAAAVADMARAGASGYDAFFRPSTFLLSVAIAAALWALATRVPGDARRLRALLRRVADRSLGVYLVHPLVLLGAGGLLRSGVLPLRVEGPLWLTSPALVVLVLATLAGSLAAVEALLRVPGGARLVGEAPGRRPSGPCPTATLHPARLSQSARRERRSHEANGVRVGPGRGPRPGHLQHRPGGEPVAGTHLSG